MRNTLAVLWLGVRLGPWIGYTVGAVAVLRWLLRKGMALFLHRHKWMGVTTDDRVCSSDRCRVLITPGEEYRLTKEEYRKLAEFMLGEGGAESARRVVERLLEGAEKRQSAQ